MTEAKITRKCCANCGNCSTETMPATKWFKEHVTYYCNVPKYDQGKRRQTHAETWCDRWKKRARAVADVPAKVPGS